MRDGATERSCCQSSLVRWSLGLAWQAIYSLFYRSFLISGQQKHGGNVSEGAEWGGVGWAGDLLEEGRLAPRVAVGRRGRRLLHKMMISKVCYVRSFLLSFVRFVLFVALLASSSSIIPSVDRSLVLPSFLASFLPSALVDRPVM